MFLSLWAYPSPLVGIHLEMAGCTLGVTRREGVADMPPGKGKRKVYTVGPDPKGGWRGEARGSTRAVAKGDNKAEVVKRTIEVAKKQPKAQVRIKGKNGRIQEERTYPSLIARGASPPIIHPARRRTKRGPTGIEGVVATSAVTDRLTKLGVPYEVIPREQAYTSIDEALALGISADEVVKTIVLDTASGHALAVIPGSRRLDIGAAETALGTKHIRLGITAEGASGTPRPGGLNGASPRNRYRSGPRARDDPAKREQRPGHVDQGRQVDEPKVSERVEVVRVVRGQRHRETDHRRRHSADPGPGVTSSHVPKQEKHPHARRGDEAGHRDVQMPDVLEQGRTERADLLLADVHFVRPDPQLEERVREVPDEEDHRVPDEPDRGGPHEPAPDPKRLVGGSIACSTDRFRRHVPHLLLFAAIRGGGLPGRRPPAWSIRHQ